MNNCSYVNFRIFQKFSECSEYSENFSFVLQIRENLFWGGNDPSNKVPQTTGVVHKVHRPPLPEYIFDRQ